ncbi:hypothetical protein [Massilia sp. erpn]|uniref:hypothetical protein n=1 Tax=Massilia sp. erpn TaxID=2738142 RepID=UPI002107D840|nr:hypothetical protein [Massilia sp. erpn]UTY60402.1 hypothetical protein HPQ68_26340 [Massilia sp. erpn]
MMVARLLQPTLDGKNMLFINVKTMKYPATLEDLYSTYPEVSFPLALNNESLIGTDFEIVEKTKQAKAEPGFLLKESAPVKENGRYKQSWSLTELPKEEINLDFARILRKEEIDTIAESLRKKIATPGAMQALIYMNKLSEALAFRKAPGASYPLLQAEVGITALDIGAVSDAVIAAHETWVKAAAQIEGVRLQAKRSVDLAKTLKEITMAGSLDWPSV